MGASLLIRTFEYTDKKTLEAKIEQQANEDAYEDGHLYSGSWGVKRGPPTYARLAEPFASVSEAEEFIQDENDKWSPVHAVPAFQEPELPYNHQSEPIQALQAKLNDLLRKSQLFNMLVVRADAANLKSEFKGCEHCSSRINLKRYLASSGHSINCPVCGGTFLWKPAHAVAKKRLDADVQKAKDALEDQKKKELKKLKLERKLVWVVGGWCSS